MKNINLFTQITKLEKQREKFAIMEKKILVKEKAFELERKEYHD